MLDNKKKTLYKPFQSKAKNKKYSVYVKGKGGIPKLISFGVIKDANISKTDQVIILILIILIKNEGALIENAGEV